MVTLLSSFAGTVALPSSKTHAARQAIPGPTLIFNDIDDATVCGSQLISWFYAGPDRPSNLFLSVVNGYIDQETGSPSSSQTAPWPSSPSVNVQIASSLDPSDKAFVWRAVTLSPGWYMVIASIPQASYVSRSSRFFVHDSGNTSCTVVNPTQSSTPASTTSSAGAIISSLTTGAQQASSPSTSTSKHHSASVVAGSVAGGAALVIFAILLFVFGRCRSRRSRTKTHDRSRSFFQQILSKLSHCPSWGGQGTVESARAFPAGSPPQPSEKSHDQIRQASNSGSFATFVDPADASPPKYDSLNQEYRRLSRPSSGEEKTLASVEDDDRNNGVHRFNSASTLTSEVTIGTQRNPSVSSRTRRTASVSPTSTPSIAIHHSTPSVSLPPAAQIRKTPRKPVPTYDPSVEVNTQTGSSPDGPPTLLSSQTSPTPHVQIPPGGSHNMTATSAAVAGVSRSHYSTRSSLKANPRDRSKSKPRTVDSESSCESITDPRDMATGGQSSLARQSSFGPGGVEGKPLHYLVPDILP